MATLPWLWFLGLTQAKPLKAPLSSKIYHNIWRHPGMYSELHNLKSTLHGWNDWKGTYYFQRGRNEPTQINVVAREHTTICLRRTSLHPNATNTTVATTDPTVLTHDSTVTTSGFSATNAATTDRTNTLSSGTILSSKQYLMPSYQFSTIADMSHIPFFALRPLMFNPFFQHSHKSNHQTPPLQEPNSHFQSTQQLNSFIQWPHGSFLNMPQ